MTWKGRNEVFYAACNLRRVVWVFRWYNHRGPVHIQTRAQQKGLCLSATRQRTNEETVEEQLSRCKALWVCCLIAAVGLNGIGSERPSLLSRDKEKSGSWLDFCVRSTESHDEALRPAGGHRWKALLYASLFSCKFISRGVRHHIGALMGNNHAFLILKEYFNIFGKFAFFHHSVLWELPLRAGP